MYHCVKSVKCLRVRESEDDCAVLCCANVGQGYYEKWAASMTQIMMERGIVSAYDLCCALGMSMSSDDHQHSESKGDGNSGAGPAFQPGDTVQVKEESVLSRWRKPHLRTPGQAVT